jgi:NifU-like protein involved in Fe-S cluster formation
MKSKFEERVRDVVAQPANLGEMPDADAVGTAGNAGCGDLLRVWIRFREEMGRRVVDQASFQTFGCETAIAMASLATEMVRGKTVEEALELRSNDFGGELGPLPPLKVHCGALVEAAFRDALSGGTRPAATDSPGNPRVVSSLSDSLHAAEAPPTRRRIVLLDPKNASGTAEK